jgi:uncharacterized protein
MRFDAFTVVLLVRAPDAPDLPEDAAAAIQDAHLAYQAGLADRGRLAVEAMTWLVPAGGAAFTPVPLPRSMDEA